MSDYRDPSHLPELDKEIEQGITDPVSERFAKWVREKMYGIDVREAIARSIQWMSVLYNKVLVKVVRNESRQNDIEGKFTELNDKFDDQLAGSTSDGEVIAARRSKLAGKTYKLLGDRLDSMEMSHYTLPLTGVLTPRTLEDSQFSSNHELINEGTVLADDELPGLVIAEIGNVTQDTLYFQKVGEL